MDERKIESLKELANAEANGKQPAMRKRGDTSHRPLSSPPTPTSTPLLPRTTCYPESCHLCSLLVVEGLSKRAHINYPSSTLRPYRFLWRSHSRCHDKHPSSWWVHLQSARSFYTNRIPESISPALPPGVSSNLCQLYNGLTYAFSVFGPL